MNITDAIIEHGAAASKSELRRLIFSKAVKLNGVLVDDLIAEVREGDVVQVGKKREFEIQRVKPIGDGSSFENCRG